ncbi:MAG TPA: hypothetical protein VFD24_10415 [Chitinophagaceae bacterium]|nr:hypothetical protein [Chitinophagaceae bacterium]HZJ60682.1 hypothetical protein [Chitinophagaceae bacterium]
MFFSALARVRNNIRRTDDRIAFAIPPRSGTDIMVMRGGTVRTMRASAFGV